MFSHCLYIHKDENLMEIRKLPHLLLTLSFAVAIFISSLPCYAQTAYTPDVGNVGLPSNGAFHGGSIDTIQLNNGNLHIDIPLLHLPGIGMDSDFHLTYDSQIWNHATGAISIAANAPTWTLITMSRPPWQFKDPIAGYLKWGEHALQWNCTSLTGNQNLGANVSNTDVDYTSFTDSDGTAHSLGISGILPGGTPALCSVPGLDGAFPTMDPSGHFQSYSGDDAGYHLTVDGNFNVLSFSDKQGKLYTFTAPAMTASDLPTPLAYSGTVGPTGVATGTGITNPAGAVELEFASIASVEDTDGNKISGTLNSTGTPLTITDTVNRTITETLGSGCNMPQSGLMPVSSDANGRQPCAITYKDQNENLQTITITYGLTSQITSVPNCTVVESNGVPQNEGCGGQIGVPFSGGALSVPTTITLQDGTQNGEIYQLSYTPNPGDTGYQGEVTSITLPTGGKISYTYGGQAISGAGRYVTSRTVTVNGQSSTWHYHYAYNSGQTTGPLTVTVTDPNQNDTVYTCNSNPTSIPSISNSASCYMTGEVSYNGLEFDQNPIVTKTTKYTAVGASILPTAEIVTWNSSNATTETDTTYDLYTPPYGGAIYVPALAASVATRSFSNPTSKTVYDYGTGSHGALLRNTQYSYLYQQNSTYANLNMFDRLAQVSVYNSATVSSTTLVSQTTTGYDNFTQTAQSGLQATTGTTQHDYTNFSASYTLRGLPTSVTKYTGPSSAAITTYTNYDDLGKPTVATDALGNATRYTYGAQNAFLASTTLPQTGSVTHVLNVSHDVNTGLLIWQQDQNLNQSNFTYDALMRPLTVGRPDGGSTSTTYPDPNHVQAVTSWCSSASSSNLCLTTSSTSSTVLDGLGRKITASTSSDANCQALTVDTTYDLLGRVSSVSNPHCASASDTDGVTTYAYDAVGRLTTKTNPDGTAQHWSFNGNVINFFDETTRPWQHTYDAMDRLIKVWEPNSSTWVSGSNSSLTPLTSTSSFETDYSYDTLGNLLSVSQWGGPSGTAGARSRKFVYDGVSRLIASNNPETSGPSNPASLTCTGAPSGSYWTQCYSYDGNSNLLQKRDNRSITSTYTYDADNRVLTKTYSDSTPSVTYTYDTSGVSGASNTKGELTAAAVKAGTTMLAQTTPYGYDTMGRLQNEQQCTPANCAGTPYAMSYAFDWTGKVTSSSVPSSANGTAGQALTLLYGYDGSGRLSVLNSNWSNGGAYPATLFSATSISSTAPAYGPMGLLNATLGISTPNPNGVIAIQRGYDSRGRVVSEVDGQVSTAGTATDSTGTITITGTEQSKTRAAAPGSVQLTVSGVDGTTQVCSYQTECNPSGTLCWQQPITPCPSVPNSGAFTATIWKDEFTPFTSSAPYGGLVGVPTDAQLAASLASAISSSGAPVSAVSAGSTVIVTANSTGPASDYPFTISNSGGGYGVSENVPYTSIGGSLTGGVTANPSDSGTVTVTISGDLVSVPFGAGSTPSSIAAALAAAINTQDGSYISASSSGGVVTLHSLVGGTSADWQLSESVTWDSADFTTASFAATDSNMNGGVNQSSPIYSYVMPLAGGYDANGNLLTASDSVMGQWTYSYDSLNRLTGAQAPVSQPAGVSGYFAGIASGWTYDAFGNRRTEGQGAIPGTSPQAAMPSNSSATYNTSNQLTAASQNAGGGLTYDASGNVIYDGTNTYLYDAESRLCAVKNAAGGLTGYVYDAAGIRVAKGGLTSFTCNFAASGGNGFAVNTSWTLGPGGEQIGEFAVSAGSSTWTHSNVFAAGKLLATYNSTGTYYDLTDWLGTKRVEVNAALTCETGFRSLPYGNGLTSYAPTALPQCADATEQHYTGKERDAESGNDYFEARYYASGFGRFMSPDWSAKEEPVPYAKLDDPQTLNLYGYVGNNPTLRADKDGHCWPLCTILAGAAAGAATSAAVEIGAQLIQHHGHISETNWGKVGNAALGGMVTGAITGAIGPGAGVALKVGVSSVAAIAGGSFEKAVNGEHVTLAGVITDGVIGGTGHKVEKIVERAFATEAVAKAMPKVVEAGRDLISRVNDKSKERPEPKRRQGN